ncbi:MAG: pyruvate kinase [Candidatus Omnitrophota bacterium]
MKYAAAGIQKRKINRRARTKIIATIGPSSQGYGVLRRMVASGLNVARINFSHGTHAEHLEKIKVIRRINAKYRRHVEILQDLEGYRIRISKFSGKEGKFLKKNSRVVITGGSDNGDSAVIPMDYEGDFRKIGKDQLIYIDDGNIILKVKSCTEKKISAVVIEGGLLKERKGVNMPGVKIPFSGVTEKDIRDLKFGVDHKVDYMAQSFVRTAADVRTIKNRVKQKLPQCRIIAKIESREAIGNIDDIIDASDAIMIARGDMGIAVPIHMIPVIQKMIIYKCNRKKKPVITATQMLEHMTEHSRPTRAEVTDVANAILDGTDFVMLSGETAAGAFPVESVITMDKIIKFTETYESDIKKRMAV